jgi:hypothetical protein
MAPGEVSVAFDSAVLFESRGDADDDAGRDGVADAAEVREGALRYHR